MHINDNMPVGEIVRAVAHEVAGIRMGHLDPHDFYDYDTGERYPTDAETAIKLLSATIEEIKQLQAHSCRWTQDDYCSICGADGRA